MARWALISGERGTDNAACALKVVAHLAAAGIRVGGFVQLKRVDDAGRKRYELVRLRGGETAVLAVNGVIAKGPTEEFFCSMAFHGEGFAAARRWLDEDMPTADVLVIDGVSKLEVSDKGHSAALDAALRYPDKVVLLCARASKLFDVVERFRLEETYMVAALELPATGDLFDAFLRDLTEGCRAQPVHA